MKNLSLIFALLLSVASFSAQAADAPFWTCKLDFEAKARGFQVIFGKFSAKGTGDIKCVSLFGDKKSLPVKVKFGSSPVALRIGMGSYTMKGTSAVVSLFSEEPEDMLGTYAMAMGGATVGIGANGMVATHTDLEDISFVVSVQVSTGLGASLGFSRLHVELDEKRYNNQK